MIEDIKKIADHFGIDNQEMKAVEELIELQEAIDKVHKNGSDSDYESFCNMLEEIADVEIMIEQIKYLHEISEDIIDDFKYDKIKRTLDRYGIGECENEI